MTKEADCASIEHRILAEETAGPSTTLRSGRDDNFVARTILHAANELSSRPERSVVEGPAVSSAASLFKVSNDSIRPGRAAFAGRVARWLCSLSLAARKASVSGLIVSSGMRFARKSRTSVDGAMTVARPSASSRRRTTIPRACNRSTMPETVLWAKLTRALSCFRLRPSDLDQRRHHHALRPGEAATRKLGFQGLAQLFGE